MKVLITGLTGFVGSHLAELLLDMSIDVVGTKRYRSRLDNVKSIQDKITWYDCELTDSIAVKSVIQDSMPDQIFHLAAISYVPYSWLNPQITIQNNIISALNLFEAVRTTKKISILNCGSAEEYGVVPEDECPIKESNSLNPVNPYALSKIGQDLIGYVYHKSYGIPIVTARAFTHTGPRRGEHFFCSNFSKQLIEIEFGIRENVVHVGNLDSVRTITDVRDMVKAYWLLNQHGMPGEVYNIGSDQTYTVREVLHKLISLTNLNPNIIVDKKRIRPAETPMQIPDYSKMTDITGWKPTISIEKTLSDLLEYWRNKIRTQLQRHEG